MDRDSGAVKALERWARTAGNVIPVDADFTKPFDLPGIDEPALDGMLFANSLHFVGNVDRVLARLARWLRPGGRAVFIEYDQRRASRWVPHPVPPARLSALAASAGLSVPIITATRTSTLGGDLYVATADAS